MDTRKECDAVGSEVMAFDGEKDLYVRKAPEEPAKNRLKLHCPYVHPAIMMRKACYDAPGGYGVAKETVRARDLDPWVRILRKRL